MNGIEMLERSAGWIATWWLHSVLLCALALAAGTRMRRGASRELLYKAALVGALVTSGAQLLGLGVGDALRVELVGAASSSSALEVDVARGELLTARGAEGLAGAPSARAPELDARADGAPASRSTWSWTHALPLAALLAALTGAARLLRDRRRVNRALAGRRPVTQADWRRDLAALAERAGLRRAARLSASTRLSSPVALARGELVVPARALTELDAESRRALLAHELAHLARRDPLWLAATAVLVRLFALNPLQARVRARLVEEMELACDERAVRWAGGGLPLARCLERVAGWATPGASALPIASMAARGSGLVRRVERALAPASPPATRAQRAASGLFVAGLLAALAGSGPLVDARPRQDEPAPKSEDASTEGEELAETSAATLTITADGRVTSAETTLYDPKAEPESFEALDAWLKELAAGMERRPLDPQRPEGRQLAMGELVLRAPAGAPFRSAQKVMARSAEAGLWRLRFAVEGSDDPDGYAVPLPYDLGDIPEALEEREEMPRTVRQEDREPPEAVQIEVALRVLAAGQKVDPRTGAPWSGSGPFEYDGSRRLEYQLGPRKARDLEGLRQSLKGLHDVLPEAPLTIDARPGIAYGDVTAVIELARELGYASFLFVGAYD